MPLYSQPVVTSAIWSGSVFQPGTVLQDVEVIKQRMYNVINTTLGSDPLRPFFGTLIYTYIDKPLLVAASNIKREITDAIALWMPEVKLDTIKYKIVSTGALSGLQFNVHSTWNGTSLPVMSFSLSRGSFVFNGLQNMVIADAAIPYNRSGQNYKPVFTVDDKAVTPAPVSGGYTTMGALLADAKANWGGFGSWGMGRDNIVCYVKSGYKRAKLNIILV